MTSARRSRAFGAVTGWWATAAQALALVLALALAAPMAGLAEDIAHHQGRHAATEAVEMTDAASAATQAGDPGVGGQVHCGCHVAVGLEGGDAASPPRRSRPRYAHADEALASIVPDRLPKPPRA